MLQEWNPREHIRIIREVLKWILWSIPIGLLVGTAGAAFLWSMQWATTTRWENPWLLYLLPLAGVGIMLMYKYLGERSEGGTNLLIDEIHKPGAGVPLRMAPLVFVGTIATHLFGGSAGREGTAMQIGGSIAQGLSRLWPGLSKRDIRVLLSAGVAAGFAGVFGTPLAGAVFAMEVLAIGGMTYEALIACLFAAVVADWAVGFWGAAHANYQLSSAALEPLGSYQAALDWGLLGKVLIAAVCFGLCARLFSELTHRLKAISKKYVKMPLLRPVLGGALIIGLVFALGTRDYLGLGVYASSADGISIMSSFEAGGATSLSWFWKLLFTAITLSSGFKGGEVTPLFFMGAALGNALAMAMGAPVELFAAMGFLAAFAGATHTPLACTIMGIELFGPYYVLYFAMGCFIAYLVSGHGGVYATQRVRVAKLDTLSIPGHHEHKKERG